MRIWREVEKTDPAHTKKVNQRGGFTAISAHYQVMRATEVFGPLGIGWGYINGAPLFTDDICVVPVTIWHGERGNTFGPLYGSADIRDSRGKADSDAPKKASTDGLTKGLSQLGFNADVFLGKFDDNKYVAAVEKEFAEAAAGPAINDDQRNILLTMLEQSGADTRGFCTFFKIEALPELPAKEYERAYAMLDKKLKAKAKPEREVA